MNPRKVYPYAPSLKTMIAGFLFFTACSIGVGLKASGNTKGIRFFRFFEWSADGATRLYAVVSFFTGLFALFALVGLWKRLARPQVIVLDEAGVELPKSIFARENMRVAYPEIVSVAVSEVMGDRTLRIDLKDGTKKEIVQNHLPSRDAFDEIAAALLERAGLVKPP